MKILTATQAANYAIELGGSVRHGLLTYALLKEGIEGCLAGKCGADFKPKDKQIKVSEWLEFGVTRVPQLYENISKGALRAVGRGSEIYGEDVSKQLLQQPSLFNFDRKGTEATLLTLK
jgi:hypothetical protein